MVLKNIVIFDGSYFLHRVLKQETLFNLKSSELERTGGIFGFFQCLQKEIKLLGNYFPIICWDQSHSPRRLALYDNYKKHREKLEDPENKPFSEMTDKEKDEDYLFQYRVQRKKIIEILNLFGIPNLLFPHTEGDDLAYWLTKNCEKSIVVSDDSDWIQMLSKTCRVRQPMKEKMLFLDEFLKEKGLESTDEFVRLKAFCGDSSDNIPGACKMCGEKGAPEFFKLYENLKINDNMKFLKESDEKTLKEYCLANDIKYKKAYLNFDENQYLTNLELVDLKRIKDEDINSESIYESIRKVYKNNNVAEVMKLINKYEIKTVNVNNIFEALVMARHNIKE